MKTAVAFILTMTVVATNAQAGALNSGRDVNHDDDINISVDATNISTEATDGNTASVTVGGIEGNLTAQGVTVINGRVWIDGKEIPRNVRRYKSKSGTNYAIKRWNNGAKVTAEQDVGK